MKNKYVAILILLLSLSLRAQQQKFEQLNQLWAGYYNSIKVNQKFAVNSDFQGRTTDWYKQWSQVLGRTSVAYKRNEKFTFSLGFADFLFFQTQNKVSKNEYRPWEEVAISDIYGKLRISNRIRIEQRYFQQVVNDELTNKYTFNHRFRYRIDLQYPLWKKAESEQALILQVGNEIMINAGKSIVYNYFDQSRTWVALLYKLNKSFSFQLQYINLFQQLSNGITLYRINVVRFNIYHTINLKGNANTGAK